MQTRSLMIAIVNTFLENTEVDMFTEVRNCSFTFDLHVHTFTKKIINIIHYHLSHYIYYIYMCVCVFNLLLHCAWPGTLCHQALSSHAVEHVRYTKNSPCLPRGMVIMAWSILVSVNANMSKAQCKTGVTPLPTHWGYCSFALNHWYAGFLKVIRDNPRNIQNVIRLLLYTVYVAQHTSTLRLMSMFRCSSWPGW